MSRAVRRGDACRGVFERFRLPIGALGTRAKVGEHGRDCDGPRLRGAASSFDFGAGGHVVGHGVGNGVVGTRRTGRAGHSAPSALSSLLELEAGVVEHRVAVGHVGRRSVLCRVLRRVGSSGSTSGGGESSLGRYLPRDTSLAGRPRPRSGPLQQNEHLQFSFCRGTPPSSEITPGTYIFQRRAPRNHAKTSSTNGQRIINERFPESASKTPVPSLPAARPVCTSRKSHTSTQRDRRTTPARRLTRSLRSSLRSPYEQQGQLASRQRAAAAAAAAGRGGEREHHEQ